MAVVAYRETFLGNGAVLVSWLGLATGDTGAPYTASALYPTKTLQVEGVFGAAGTVTLQGSNSDVGGSPTYAPLNDRSGTALSFTTAGLKTVLENPRQLRPSLAGGDATTALNIRITMATLPG